MSKHVTTSPNEAPVRLAIRERSTKHERNDHVPGGCRENIAPNAT